ncbi:MAG: ABC transporter permease subunit/CPBP intramembrane protease [Pirellulales bacterium]
MNTGSAAPTPALVEPSGPSPVLPRNGGWRRVLRLAGKELRETISDRRTIITLVLMPLFLYPVLSIGLRQYFLTSLAIETQREYRLGFRNEEEASWFWQYLQLETPRVVDPSAPARDPRSGPLVQSFLVGRLDESVRAGDISVGVKLNNFRNVEQQAPGEVAIECELLVAETSVVGREALEFLERKIAQANARYLAARLRALGVRQRSNPLAARREVLTADDYTGPASLATVIPLVLLLMTITGAVYPAIDLTAGERERGTLEILIAAPVPRVSLLLAKYIAVLTVATLTATINLTAMTITLSASGLWSAILGRGGLSIGLVAQVFALLLLFAAFFSAVLLCITSFARSFKEAQAYLVPLMLISLAPGMLSLLPSVSLKGLMTIAPLINITLLGRDLLTGAPDPAAAALVVLSTLVYALAAITLAAKIFGAEAVLYSSHAGWSDWFTRPASQQAGVSPAAALLTLAVLFPTYFFTNSAISLAGDLTMGARLLIAGLATALLFAVMPLAVAAWVKAPIVDALGLRRPRGLALVGSAVLGVSLWPWAHEIVVGLHDLGVNSISETQIQLVKKMLDQWRALPPWAVLIGMAMLPAACEELFFRGFLQGSLAQAMGRRLAVLLAALAFGVFHLFTTDGLAPERFLATTFLGLVLGWVFLASGSVWPGMLLHATHNGLLILLAYYQPLLAARGWGVEEQSHMPATWLAASALGIVCGATLVAFGRRTKPSQPGEPA